MFPIRLVLALVVFIFKAGEPTLLTNYRTISLLNVISKSIEKLVDNVLSDSQFGFRNNHSTEQTVNG